MRRSNYPNEREYIKNMTLKHILEYQNYSDEDIKDLMGDLEGVGQSTVAKASVWVEYTITRSLEPYAIRKMLTTDPFYVTGNEGVDSELALKTISEGKFIDDSVHHTGGPKSDKVGKVWNFSKTRIQELAKECLEDREGGEIPMDPLEYFGSRLASESIKAHEAKYQGTTYMRVDFSIFIAPPGDPSHKDSAFRTLPPPFNEIIYRVK